jgi:hypothetical protein
MNRIYYIEENKENREFENFKKWVDSVKEKDITNIDEAVRICILMLNQIAEGKRIIDGKFEKIN